MENETVRPDMTYAEVEPQGLQLLGTPQQLAALFGALAAAQSAFKPVHKNREVTIRTDKGPYTFAYAELSQSLDATRDALGSNGLAVSQPFSLGDGYATVRTILSHREGGLMISTCHLQQAKAMKDLGGLLTYCRRYAFNALLSLAADEDLDDQPEASRGETGAQSGPRTPKQEEPRRAPQTPQTQAKPANAGQAAPKAQAPAGQPNRAGSPPDIAGQAGTAASEPPKAQGAQPSASAPANTPSTLSASQSSTTATSGATSPTSPEGTPLTQEQRANIYALLGKLGIAGPRQATHLTAVMGRLGLSGKVTGESYQRVVDALTAEQGG